MARASSRRRETIDAFWPAALFAVTVVLGARKCAQEPTPNTVARTEESSRPATPRRAPPLPPLPAFPRHSSSRNIEVFSDVDQPVDELRTFADGALEELRGWMGVPPDPFAPRYSVYLCGSLDVMRDLEAAKGQPRSDPWLYRTFEFRGGFYSQARMISLRCDARDDMRFQLAHELSHVAFHEKVGKECDAINEGLAEYNAGKILGWVRDARALCWTEDGKEERALPSLKSFFSLGYWQFRADRVNARNFCLSEVLVRILQEEEHPEIQGRFPTLLARMQEMHPWQAMRATYDVALVEEKWKRTCAAVTAWEPVFGEWTLASDELRVKSDPSGFGVIVWRDPVEPDRPFEARCELVSSPGENGEVGFVVGYRGREEFTAVVLRPRSSTLCVAHLCGPGWDSTEHLSLEGAAGDPTSGELELRCDEQGSSVLTLGTRVLARFTLESGARTGRVGLYVNPEPMDGADCGSAVFASARVMER